MLINYAIHHDEASPHAHLRGTFVWYDDDGVAHMGQDEALKRAGIELPDPDKKRGQYNNRKMAFDRMLREWWIEIVEAHGYVIEKEPVKGVEHLTVKEYKAKKEAEKEITEKAAQLEAKEQEIQARADELEAQRQEIEARAAELTAREQNIEKEVEARLEDRVKALDAQQVKLDSRERLISRKIRELDAEERNIDKVAAARLKEKEIKLDETQKEVETLRGKFVALLQKYEQKIQELEKGHPLVAWAKRWKWNHNGKTVTIWETYQEEQKKEAEAEKKVEQEAKQLIVKDPYRILHPSIREVPTIQSPQQDSGMSLG